MNFIVYSKPGCPYCEKVIQVFTLTEQKFVEYKLGRDFNANEFYGEFGQGTSFPQIVVNEVTPGSQTKIGGCSETIKFLKENKVL